MGLFSFGRNNTTTNSQPTKKKAVKRVSPYLIQVRATKEEKTKLIKWAHANEMTVSQVIRELIKRLS